MMAYRLAVSTALLMLCLMAAHYANVYDGRYLEWVPPWDNPALQDHGEMHNGWQEGSALEGRDNEWSYLVGDRTGRDWIVCAYDRNRNGVATAARAGIGGQSNAKIFDIGVDAFRTCNYTPPVKRNNDWHQTGTFVQGRGWSWLPGRSRH